MSIWVIIIILLVIAIILFLWSLFAVDKPSELEEEFNDTSNELYREIASLNKRVKTLEKALQGNAPISELNDNVPNEMEKEVIALYAKGYTVENIADTLDLPDKVVKETVNKFIES